MRFRLLGLCLYFHKLQIKLMRMYLRNHLFIKIILFLIIVNLIILCYVVFSPLLEYQNNSVIPHIESSIFRNLTVIVIL